MSSEISSIDWEEFGGKLTSFDDGHIPENLGNTSTKLVDYPALFDRDPQVHVYANAFPEALVDAVYKKTLESPIPSWGDYVTIENVEEYWKDPSPNAGQDLDLVVALAAHFLELAEGEREVSEGFGSSSTSTSMWTRGNLQKAHGVAIWALAAKVGSQVPYHLDYAEQIRYDSNVIVPPLLAGTLQCTRDKLEGGDFVVSLEGIPHYKLHGYKSKTQCVSMDKMVHIPYRFNQLTCHLGNLPHGSTKVEAILGDQLRVIVGFNVFGYDIGPIVQRAPEHSSAFRRKVQVERVLSKTKNLSLAALKQNKPLTKLLVLAKRERIKQEFKQAQERLAQELPQRLPATIQDLMDQFYTENNDLCWPASPVDVQVYLHHQIQQGHYRIIGGDEKTKDLVSPLVKIDLAERQ
jgi:hypothetical protein